MPSGQAVNPVTGGSWEGVGVKPDGAVPAPQALSKAHRLAVQRLLDETRDPVPPSLLEAVAMKLESLAQAESVKSFGSLTRSSSERTCCWRGRVPP
jgi:hypothetical protein